MVTVLAAYYYRHPLLGVNITFVLNITHYLAHSCN